ncbi:MAG TPA: vanadium-dependent haloperoxidase [Casimicrobiaceae bacterium]
MKLHRSLCVVFAVAATFLLARPALADAVLDWNDFAVTAVLASGQRPPDGARAMAMMHVAIFDAINAIEQKYQPYAYSIKAAKSTSADAAAAAAAQTVLSKLFPDQTQTIESAYAASLAKISDGDAKTAGVALGRDVGSQCLAMRANDGAGGPATYKQKVTAGVYVPTAFVVSSEWVKIKPWFMRETTQFRPGPPPALTSAVWSRDFEEIRTIGARNSTARTREQTDVARFWTVTGVASWNPIVRSLAKSANLSLIENARLFALVNMAASDAFVAVFDAKYAYEFWRPVTAIRYESDAAWLPLVDTPMHPEYPCAHCISAAAVGAVLESQFGKGTILTVTMTSPTAPGVARSWTRIADYVEEVSNARVWGGIHYRNSTQVGEQMGRTIGEFAVKSFMRPLGQ